MIQFHTDSVEMPDIQQALLTGWIQRVAALHGKKAGTINLVFCNDERILSINRSFLEHDYYTDIITFDTGVQNLISGDIYISLDTVSSNAAQLNIPYNEELHRVIIHGILHLCGYPDKLPEDASRMRKVENEALALIQLKPAR